ncbi:MAG: Ger(x)C family spore germination protein [Bacillota bacterium]
MTVKKTTGKLLKRAALTLIILLLAVSQPSCWDRREVEQLGLVLATAIDTAPNGRIRVTVQNVNPAGLGKGTAGGTISGGVIGNKPYRNRTIEADSLFEAFRQLSKQTPRQLFFAHNQEIIFSENLARERGLKDILDFLDRNPQIRRTTWLLVGKGDLRKLLDEPGRLETTPAQRIQGIIEERHLTSQYAPLRLGEFLEKMDSETTAPYTAIVERISNPSSTEEHKNRLSEGLISEPHMNIKINGTALFRGDKMAGRLNARESRGLLWVLGKVKGGSIEIPVPGQQGKLASLEIIREKTKLKPEIRDGQVYMEITVKEDSSLAETGGNPNISSPDTIKEMENLLAGAIKDEIRSALDKAQREYRLDVFGFGEAVHRKYPRQWKEMKNNWKELYPDVQVEVRVEAVIRRTGMTTNPVKVKQ